MERIFTLIVGLAIALGAMAANMSSATRLRLLSTPTQSRYIDETKPYQPLMLQVAGDEVVDELLALDVIIYNSRADILLTSVPRDRLDEVLALPGIINAGASGDMSSVMDKARPFGHVDAVQLGTDGLCQGYDGAAIVAGFSDIGFDAHHIAFADRIAAVYDFDAYQGIARSAETPDEIAQWVTDDPDEFHATHVANILAGGYKGNEYYGVATGAEIVATTSRLSDVGILAGVEKVIEHAKHVGRPAVINLSLANFLGPHDGTDLFCQYLSRCADDAVICISAGNSATTSGYAWQDLTPDDKTTQVMLNTRRTWNGYDVDGMTEIWSDASQTFSYRIEVYDMDIRGCVYSSPWMSGESLLTLDASDAEWSQYMAGEIRTASGWSNLNGRYNVAVMYDTHTTPSAANSDGRWSRYYTALSFKADDRPLHIDIFADATYSTINRTNTDVAPHFDHTGSINDLCTAPGIVSVGACSSRNTAPLIGGGEVSWKFDVDNVAEFSSFSTVYTIPRLPHFAAPGNYVVSAVSGAFIDTHPDAIAEMSAASDVDGTTYYWAPQCGTSMSSPYAAGVIAQWLELDPSLKSEDVIAIAQETAITSYPDIDNPRWGAGCIDALAGIRHIASSAPIAVDDVKPIVRVSADGVVTVTAADGTPLPFDVYDITGKAVAAPLSKGIYIIHPHTFNPIKIILSNL